MSLYFGNYTRNGKSYSGTPIGTRMQFIEWCHSQWSLTQISTARRWIYQKGYKKET